MGRTAGSGTWWESPVGVYPKAKALGYYMGRTSGSGAWWESPVGMEHIVAMDFSPLAVGMEHIVTMDFSP